MAVDFINRALGLVTQYNPYNVAPGALTIADNCVIQHENVIESRRGHARRVSLSNTVGQIQFYMDQIIAHNGTALSYTSANFTTSNDFAGSYNAPSGQKMRSVEGFSNLYFTTDVGIQVATGLSASAGTIRKAGCPRSLDGAFTLTNVAGGFLADTNQVAYRFVIQLTDANKNVIQGYPSTRMWVYNGTGSAANVAITLYLPAEVTTSYLIQAYRTNSVSVGTSDKSGDEMQLVYQISPSSTDISNGYITFTDIVNDALMGAALYTNPSQQGIQQANDRPPVAKDITSFRSRYTIFSNTQTKQRLNLTVLATVALYNGGAYGKSIKVAGVTYTFTATEVPASGQVLVNTPGIAATDIDATARSLVRCINRNTLNTAVYAYYLSGPSDPPGLIMIEERGIGAAAFTVQSLDTATAADFFPPPPVSPATNADSSSTNSANKNFIYFSKDSQPEHVPIFNNLPVGSANKNILRVAALRDSVIIVKEDGVFRMVGDSPQSFVITPLDLTVKCVAADSVAVLANQVIMLSNQGVVAISDTGVQVISREIEPTLKPLLTYANISTASCGIAYETDRTYLLSTISLSSDTVQTQTFAYNLFTKAWTRQFTFGINAAVVEPTSNTLFLSKPGIPHVYRERKDFADSDYADPEGTITISSVAGRTVSFILVAGSVSGEAVPVPQQGWVISQGGTGIPISSVISVGAGFKATVSDDPPSGWGAGSATLFPGVNPVIEWNAWTGGQAGGGPGTLKQTSEFAVFADNLAGNNTATSIIMTFRTNLDPASESVTKDLTYGTSSGWGGAWGIIPFGGGASGDSKAYRTYVPRNKAYCSIMNVGVQHLNAQERLAVAGCGFVFVPCSERVSR